MYRPGHGVSFYGRKDTKYPSVLQAVLVKVVIEIHFGNATLANHVTTVLIVYDLLIDGASFTVTVSLFFFNLTLFIKE